MKVILFLFCFIFCGCGFYDNSFKPQVLAEKKILSSRKAEIIQNNKVAIVVIATYLNNVNPDIYNTREYFFIEVFSELDIPLLESMEFSITNNERFLWIREVNKDEFDGVINVSNKWSRGFLIAFNDIDEYDKKNMKLNLVIDNVGEMNFDFTYEVFEIEF